MPTALQFVHRFEPARRPQARPLLLLHGTGGNECAIDREHVSRGNPTGCQHDLQSAITTTFATSPLTTPPQVRRDTGQTMAVFNMQQGDVPLFKSLADQFTMSDNYHQPVRR